MIEVRDLHKAFGPLEVLKGISLSLAQGKVLVIIGPSGSGKTTLLRCLNLLETPDRGSLEIAGQRLEFKEGSGLAPKAVRALRLKTGMVFQSFNLFPHMTVLQNIMEGPVTVQRRSRAEAASQARELLGKVGLADKADAYPHQLSGGQQQRVAIARAMATAPEVLLFDEPTSALDPELVGDVLKVIRQLAFEGMTMVVVTHEMAFAADVADHLVLMDGGIILEQGPPDRVLGHAAHPRAVQFLSRLRGEEHQ
ncbi:amino acid ABC transporter ATP-binding protein [Paenibacillus tepidiphilus]|uniref:amino acid ABC transporter ATP-binding protein n=1 Tax=Paenibacillus tepidiphilus TaxID=2608683 RepID=UPI00123BDCAD|nr:amino acid ABC transporter ATP-binding protein [Paenibacillus tepidiphilus]